MDLASKRNRWIVFSLVFVMVIPLLQTPEITTKSLEEGNFIRSSPLSTNYSITPLQQLVVTNIDVQSESISSMGEVVADFQILGESGIIDILNGESINRYYVIEVTGFYTKCNELSTNPTRFFHGLPSSGVDGFLYFALSAEKIVLVEESQDGVLTMMSDEAETELEFRPRAQNDEFGPPIPIYSGNWNLQNNVVKFDRQLVRMGLFHDTSVSGLKLHEYCAEMFSAHAKMTAQFDITFQIEFIKTISKSNTSAEIGYGYLENTPCHNNKEMKDWMRVNAVEVMENGSLLKKYQPDFNYSEYNRGKYIDLVVYVTEDSFWNFGNARGCASFPTGDDPSVVIINNTQNALDFHTYMHEVGHTFNVYHNTRECYNVTTGWWIFSSTTTYSTVMGTLNSSSSGYCQYDIREERFSSDSTTRATSSSNIGSTTNLPIHRYSAIPLVKSQTNNRFTLLSFNVDVMSDSETGPTECERFYRAYYHLRNDMTVSSSVSEFFIGIRSDYLRNAPGEWDYWLKYDRIGHILHPGDDYVFRPGIVRDGSGWVKDDHSNWNSSSGFLCSTNVNDAVENHHPYQGGNPTEWRFHVVYNTGGIFNATYNQYFGAEIRVNVGI